MKASAPSTAGWSPCMRTYPATSSRYRVASVVAFSRSMRSSSFSRSMKSARGAICLSM